MYSLAKLILKLALLRMQMLKQGTALLVYLQRVVALICWAPQKSLSFRHLSPNINSFKRNQHRVRSFSIPDSFRLSMFLLTKDFGEVDCN